MADYNSKYSGAQIDEAVGRAVSGGAIDKSLADKAPAGYGFGSTTPKLAPTNGDVSYDADAVLESCFFVAKNNTPLNNWCYGLCISRADKKKLQIMWGEQGSVADADDGCYAQRLMKAGVWGKWEYINPPMKLGVEYRTTERYMGKPVYTKLLKFGTLPNSTSKSFAHGISSLGYVVDIYGQGVAGQDVKVSVDTTNITITSTSNLSAVTAYPVIKYTKTTD